MPGENYERVWEYWECSRREDYALQHPRLDFIIEMVRRSARRRAPVANKRVLDIGFGDGYLLKTLCRLGFECHGIDISLRNVETTTREALREHLKLNLKTGEAATIPFETETFRFVVAAEILEHLDYEQLRSAVKEIVRVLIHGGEAFITVPYNENLEMRKVICPKCLEVFHPSGHLQTFDETRVRSLTEGLGLRTLRTETKFYTDSPPSSIAARGAMRIFSSFLDRNFPRTTFLHAMKD